jgi:predicted dehydrogenase
MSIPERYNIGVIGAGWIAKAHMGFLKETGRATISWIAARNPERLEKVRHEFKIPNKTQDYHEILKDPSVDLVLIATPPDTHRDMFIAALKAGKHVLLEKPMALSMKELEDMMQIRAQFPHLIAMECSARHSRLNPKFKMVKDLVSSGALGKVYHIHHQGVKRQERPGIEFHPVAKWFLDRSRAGGGPLFDWGVYDLSFHLGILGDEPQLERVENTVLKNGLDDVDPRAEVYDVEEHLLVNMQFSGGISYYWERGVHAHVEVPNETRIYGTRGGIKLAYCTWDDPEIALYDLDDHGVAREKRFTCPCPAKEDGFYLSRHLIAVLDGKEQPAVSLDLARKHMEIIFRCRDWASELATNR